MGGGQSLQLMTQFRAISECSGCCDSYLRPLEYGSVRLRCEGRLKTLLLGGTTGEEKVQPAR